MPRFLAPIILALTGAVLLILAVRHERRMHRHRQPGVTYWQATWRRDGAWRRTDLFTPEGLRHQREAARWGWIGAILWLLALIALAMV